MSAEQLVERIIANESSIKLGLVKSGMMNQQEWVRFNTTVEKIKNVNLYFDDSSGLTIQNIRAKCRKLKSEGKVDFIIIDYLQLISGTANDERISEQEKIAKISRNLKLMARELEVPVLALSQLSREVDKREDKRPVMSDLRSSGAIEQDADIIMFLYRKDKDRSVEAVTGETDLLIEKNRSGSSTRDGIHFIFTGEYQSFKEKKED
jgi:replicative DNA helicase